MEPWVTAKDDRRYSKGSSSNYVLPNIPQFDSGLQLAGFAQWTSETFLPRATKSKCESRKLLLVGMISGNVAQSVPYQMCLCRLGGN